jgi:hypothetical protein
MYFLQFWRLEVQGEGSCICQGPLCHTIHRQGQKGRKYEREREREKERERERESERELESFSSCGLSSSYFTLQFTPGPESPLALT